MKKTMLILSAVALILTLLVGGGIWFLISRLTGASRPTEKTDLETYLAEHWTFYRLRSWDPDSGVLELENPQKLAYAQMEKYGEELDLGEDAAAQAEQIRSLRIGLREACGISPTRITVYGISSDGLEAYRVEEDGSVTACWQPDS